MKPSEKEVLQALRGVRDPELGMDIVSMGMIKDLTVKGGDVSFTLELTTPACPFNSQIEQMARSAVEGLPGVKSVNMRVTARVRQGRPALQGPLEIPGIKNVVAVASGKGGVGKTTVATNLAVALAETGAASGILDADIYGSSLTRFIRSYRFDVQKGGRITPAEGPFGLKMMSMGLLVPDDTPIIWRGPLVGGAIRQMLTEVDWGELDYLIVDLPPGTGDAPLTLAQTIPITGAVIVTTPQQASLDIAIKALRMFQRLGVEILGIVENMSFYVCPECGRKEYIFGRGGGLLSAERLDVPLLAEIPLLLQLRENSDNGTPIITSMPHSEAAETFRSLARRVAAALSVAAVRRGAK
ncbi:MAG: Mrp/NBP35 family ATP-binding protein [Nitrososphaerota archaeon]|nr:Mrp/NBP35 family ATP-binding protein [Candidatus Calditenuaceae archaeon]MDW8072645.1 Mrp/NBP35 family ATP-binding protein [Nitrososphaerota archaeon]